MACASCIPKSSHNPLVGTIPNSLSYSFTSPYEGIIAEVIEEITGQGDVVLAHEGLLSGEQARRFAAEVGRLPTTTKMADRFNWLSRLGHLNFVVVVSRGGPEMEAFVKETKSGSIAQRIDFALTDWNDPMQTCNKWHDRIVAAMSKPTRPERLAALADASRDFQPVVDDATDEAWTFRKVSSAAGLGGSLPQAVGSICHPGALVLL